MYNKCINTWLEIGPYSVKHLPVLCAWVYSFTIRRSVILSLRLFCKRSWTITLPVFSWKFFAAAQGVENFAPDDLLKLEVMADKMTLYADQKSIRDLLILIRNPTKSFLLIAKTNSLTLLPSSAVWNFIFCFTNTGQASIPLRKFVRGTLNILMKSLKRPLQCWNNYQKTLHRDRL